MTGPVAGSERQGSSGLLRQHYERPPIQEAVIDLHFELPTDVRNETRLHAFHEALDGHLYGPADECGPEQLEPPETVGIEFRSEAPVEIVRATTAGRFSYRKVPPPYTNWEEWSPRALGAFVRYQAVMQPISLQRASVRYVNGLNLPELIDLSNYLLVYPEIPPGLPQKVAGFFMQTVLPHEERGIYIILRMGQIPAQSERHTSIVLDIEALQWRHDEPPIEPVASRLNRLHEIAVDAFERCITNRTRELFR